MGLTAQANDALDIINQAEASMSGRVVTAGEAITAHQNQLRMIGAADRLASALVAMRQNRLDALKVSAERLRHASPDDIAKDAAVLARFLNGDMED